MSFGELFYLHSNPVSRLSLVVYRRRTDWRFASSRNFTAIWTDRCALLAAFAGRRQAKLDPYRGVL